MCTKTDTVYSHLHFYTTTLCFYPLFLVTLVSVADSNRRGAANPLFVSEQGRCAKQSCGGTSPLPPPSPSFHTSPLRNWPLIASRGLESALAPLASLGGARPPSGIWGNFELKISPLVATIFRSFSGNETNITKQPFNLNAHCHKDCIRSFCAQSYAETDTVNWLL